MSLSYNFNLFLIIYFIINYLLLYYNIIIAICLDRGKKTSGVDAKVVTAIKSMLDEHNPISSSHLGVRLNVSRVSPMLMSSYV